MTGNRLLTLGFGGFILTAICCFTPLLVIVFTAAGLSAWIAGLDLVLFPLLFAFLALTVYALWMRRTRKRQC